MNLHSTLNSLAQSKRHLIEFTMATTNGIKFLVFVVLFSFNFYCCSEASENLEISKKIEDIAVGKYQMDLYLDCDDYLKELNVGYLTRTAAASTKPKMEVTVEGGQWTIKVSTIVTSTEFKFKVGEKNTEIGLDDNEYESIATIDGNKLMIDTNPIEEGLKSTKSVREFTDEGCTMTTTIIGSNTSCVQEFKRL